MTVTVMVIIQTKPVVSTWCARLFEIFVFGYRIMSAIVSSKHQLFIEIEHIIQIEKETKSH